MGFRAAVANTRELFRQRASPSMLQRYRHYDLWHTWLHFVRLNNVRFIMALSLYMSCIINLTSRRMLAGSGR